MRKDKKAKAKSHAAKMKQVSLKQFLAGILVLVAVAITFQAASAINLYNCTQALTQPGGNYVLQNDITSGHFWSYGGATICFRTNTSGVTIDCNGHTITTPAGAGTNVIIYYQNVSYVGGELENCIIENEAGAGASVDLFFWTGTGTFSYPTLMTNTINIHNSSSFSLIYKTSTGNVSDGTIDGNNVYFIGGAAPTFGLFGSSSGSGQFGNNAFSGNNLSGGSFKTASLGTLAANIYYDNYFFDWDFSDMETTAILNITPYAADNIIGGIMTGGNFYGAATGLGYSQVCDDDDADGFCDDTPYEPNGGGNGADYAPLSIRQPTTPTAGSCTVANDCFLNESFNYNDEIVNHNDWSYQGSRVPSGGALYCVPNVTNQGIVYNLPADITTSSGIITVHFKASICDGPNAKFWIRGVDFSAEELYLNVLFEPSANRIRVSDLQDGNKAFAWTPTCTDLTEFSTYDLIFNTADGSAALYEDGVLLGSWTLGPETLGRMHFIVFDTDTLPEYCNWAIDNMKITRYQPPYSGGGGSLPPPGGGTGVWTPSNRTESFLFGDCGGKPAFNLTPGGGGFNRAECCDETENSNLCLLEQIVKGLLGYGWDAVKNNFFLTLALVFFVVLFFVLKQSVK